MCDWRLGPRVLVSLHQLKAEAGETYYFVPHVVGDPVYAVDVKYSLSQMDPDEGKDLVARAKFSESHPK